MTQKYNEIYQKSIDNREDFWKEISNDIFWYKKPTKILNSDNPPFFKWFEDGVTNTCYNALDLHIDEGKGEKLAIIPIDTSQNEIPTKSFVCKRAVAALAELVIPKKATAAKARRPNFLMKTSLVCLVFV